MFKYIKSFFTALNANAHPGDIAHAVAFGLFLALVPRGNLLWIILFSFMIFVRINKGAFFISLILLSFVAPFADSLLDRLGYFLLTMKAAEPLFVAMIDTPFVGLTRFNNSVVAGAVAAGLIAYAPVYFAMYALVRLYRDRLQQMIVNSKAYKVIVNLPVIKQIVEAPSLGEVIK